MVEDLGDLPLVKSKAKSCEIDSITQVSKDVIKVILRLPLSSSVEYFVGQYPGIIKRKIKRSCSMSNASNVGKFLGPHIKKVE